MSEEEIKKIYSEYGINEVCETEYDEYFPKLQYKIPTVYTNDPITLSNKSYA